MRPQTAALLAQPAVRHEIREHVNGLHPELKHNLSALRRESIRLALNRSGDDPGLAEPAFEVFFAERNRVTLFDDALQSLAFLAGRFPLVALSNGNADIQRIGIAPYFKASLSAQQFGVGKPDPRIFQAAASAAGVQPHEVLHVGDDAALDVLAALDLRHADGLGQPRRPSLDASGAAARNRDDAGRAVRPSHAPIRLKARHDPENLRHRRFPRRTSPVGGAGAGPGLRAHRPALSGRRHAHARVPEGQPERAHPGGGR